MKSTTTFTFNGTVYTANGTKNHCYRWPEGLKGERVRINKAKFEAAEDQYNAECKARIEKAADDMIAYREAAEKAIEEQDAQQELEDELRESAENFEDSLKCVEPTAEPKKTPKAKKSTKKAAYQSRIVVADDKVADVTLTEKQVDFIRHLPDTYFWQDGVESVIWIDCLCDDIKGQFAGKPMTVGAMISTLCEKDLGLRTTCRRENRKCVSFELTELGQLVAKELGLN